MFRSPRLEALFGKRVDQLTYADVTALLHNPAAAEASDLEYKKLVHARNDEQKDEFCKDIVGLGNDQGGVLLIGVDEDANAVPVAINDVETTDQERRRLTDLLLQTSPHLPVHITALPNTSGATLGVLLVIVERSPMAPHAVLSTRPQSHHRDGFLRYPIRNGASTRWMLEPEVATRYRRRFTEARGTEERLDAVEEEASAAYMKRFPTRQMQYGIDEERQVLPVLTVSLVPDTPGNLRINGDVYQAFQREVRSAKDIDGHVMFSATRVSSDKLIGSSGGKNAPDRYAEFHADGSASLLFNLNPPSRLRQGGDVITVSLELAMQWLLSGLLLLGQHARDRAGASGIASVRFRIVSDVSVVHWRAGDPHVSEDPLPLHVQEANGAVHQTTEEALGAADAFVDALAEECPELLSVASLLADQAFQAFGLPEVQLITPEGQIVSAEWGRLADTIKAWAAQANLGVN